MNTSRASYLVQRQLTPDGDWLRVTGCGSLEYAELIAAVGIANDIAASYRVIRVQTGETIELGPAVTANAVSAD